MDPTALKDKVPASKKPGEKTIEKQVLVPCEIPYIFGSLENSDKGILPDTINNQEYLEKLTVSLKIEVSQ